MLNRFMVSHTLRTFVPKYQIVFLVDSDQEKCSVGFQKTNSLLCSPIVLQHQDYDKSDHFWNLISFSTPLKDKLVTMPILFISLVLSKYLLFFDEFLEGLLKQNYPKQNIILCISDEAKNSTEAIKLLQEGNFGEVLQTNTELNIVQQRIDALKMFEISSADFVLFLNNSVILNNANTFNKLVMQDLDVVAPMIRTNVFAPKWEKYCEWGWNRSMAEDIPFPNPETKDTWFTDKYIVS